MRLGTGLAMSWGMGKTTTSGKWLVLGLALVVGGTAARTARAEEGVEKALSFSAGLGSESSDRVRDAGGGASDKGGGIFGLTALASVGPLAVGASTDSSSNVGGIATRTFGALGGARLEVSPSIRVLALGEAGVRTFYDAPDLVFGTQVTPDELTLPYLGVRAGASWLFSRFFDVGAMAFFRKDLRTGTMTTEQEPFLVLPHSEPTSTTHVYEVGGLSAGLSLQIGFRLDTRRPFVTN